MKTTITDKEVKTAMKRYMDRFKWENGLTYNPTEKGLTAIMKEFKKNKAPLISLFEKSPHYNGKYQIVLKDETYQRKIDVEEIYKFTGTLYRLISKPPCIDLSDKNIFVTGLGGYYTYTHDYSLSKVFSIDWELGEMTVMPIIQSQDFMISNAGEKYDVSISRFKTASPKEIQEKLLNVGIIPVNYNPNTGEFSRECNDLQELFEKETLSFEEIKEKYDSDPYFAMRKGIDLIYRIREQYLTEEEAEHFNDLFPELRARCGQKTTKIVNKFCINILKLKKEKGSEFALRFSAYCDAMNPLVTPRWTIISIHPVDFLAMSNGYDWGSCHTLDKLRDDGNYYNGCYSSGTLSYMLDSSSFIFYTVQREYDGNEFEFEPKMSRCMFHYGNDKLVQGRVYPQDNDGINAVYKEIRPIVQRIITEALKIPNLWRNSKGTEICADTTLHTGTHFKDVLEYNNCNVSYYGSSDSGIEKNPIPIEIGHYPICPHCGDVHLLANNILCGECQRKMIERSC